MTNYNLDDLLQHENTSIHIRREIPESLADGNLRRFKERSILIVGLSVLIILFLLCIFFILQDHNNSLAMNTAVGVGSIFAGYILRGKL